MRSYRRTAAFGLVLTAFGALTCALTPTREASAQLTSASSSDAGSTAPFFQDDLIFSYEWAKSVAITNNTPSSITSRYRYVLGTDSGTGGDENRSSSAQHNLSFTATAPGAYVLTVTSTRNGAMTREDDGSQGSMDTSGVSFTHVTANGTVSGTTNLPDPAANSGSGDANVSFNASTVFTITNISNGAPQNHTLRFNWNQNCFSDWVFPGVTGGDECAIRGGLAISYGGETAGDYPGQGGRNIDNDGHFITVTITSLCGNGVVDAGVGEQCDLGGANGANGNCCTSSCQIRSVGQTCRVSAGDCDVVETCDGVLSSCPADGFVAGGTECRGLAGNCDIAESCTGSEAACPADTFVAGGTECRASGGVCDPAESCTGASGVCPTDDLTPAGTECRPAFDLCDEAEECDGVNVGCPTDAIQPAGTTCRGSAGDCDPAELCTGSSIVCPVDQLEPATTVCRPQSGACDFEELCTGADVSCPPDIGSPDTDSDTVCDAVDNCDGDANLAQEDDDGDEIGNVCDPCTNIVPVFASRPAVRISKLDTPPSDDKLSLSGSVVLPLTPTIDPIANGMRVVIADEQGDVHLDAIIPGGDYDPETKLGWKINKSGTTYSYKNRNAGALIQGINRITLAASSTPGLYRFRIKGKNASLPITPADLPLLATIVIDSPTAETGQCGEAPFDGNDCAFNSSQKTLRCRDKQ